MEEKRRQAAAEEDIPKENERVGLNEVGVFDTDLYTGSKSKYDGYHTTLAMDDVEEDDDMGAPQPPKRASYTAPLALLNDVAQAPEDYDPFAEHKRPKIIDREDEYRQRKRNAIISPARVDPFANGGATPDIGSRGYSQIMREQNLKAEEADLQKQMKERAKEGTLKVVEKAPKRRGRWDMTTEETPSKTPKKGAETPTSTPSSASGDTSTTPARLNQWDATPGHKDLGSETPGASATPRMWDPTPAHVTPGHHGSGSETPAAGAATPGRRNRWDETPRTERETPGHGAGWAETPRTDRGGGGGGEKIISDTPTPSASKRRSRWDETPSATPSMGGGSATPTPSASATPSGSATPSMMTPGGTTPSGSSMMTPSMSTPMGAKAMAMATPHPSQMMQMTPEQLQAFRWEQEIDSRNRPLSDEELDGMFPPGYKVLQPPAGYIPIRTPSKKLTATPTPMVGQTPTGFYMQPDTPMGDRMANAKMMDNQPKGQNLPFLKPEDAQYFDKLLVDVDEESLSPEELKERQIMELLLKIKNGTPPMRKSALR